MVNSLNEKEKHYTIETNHLEDLHSTHLGLSVQEGKQSSYWKEIK